MTECFKSIFDLIVGLDRLKQDAWIHTDVEVWLAHPEAASFYYVPWDYLQSLGDDEVWVDDDGMELPLALKDKNLREWMLVNGLVHIAKSMRGNLENSKEFIDQVNYYREFDTFKP